MTNAYCFACVFVIITSQSIICCNSIRASKFILDLIPNHIGPTSSVSQRNNFYLICVMVSGFVVETEIDHIMALNLLRAFCSNTNKAYQSGTVKNCFYLTLQ